MQLNAITRPTNFQKTKKFFNHTDPFRDLSAFGIDECRIPTSSLFLMRLPSLYLPLSVSLILLKATVTLKPSEMLQERASGVGSHPGAFAFFFCLFHTSIPLLFPVRLVCLMVRGRVAASGPSRLSGNRWPCVGMVPLRWSTRESVGVHIGPQVPEPLNDESYWVSYRVVTSVLNCVFYQSPDMKLHWFHNKGAAPVAPAPLPLSRDRYSDGLPL